MAGLFGAPIGMRGTRLGGGFAPMTQPVPQMPQPMQPQKKPGLGTRLLGQGWEEKVAALGGLLRGDPNAVGNYQALQQHRADQAEALRQASLKPEAEFQDWVRRQQWERANPKPTNNDTVADYEFIRQQLGDEEAEKFLRNRADPPRYVQGPDGQFYPVQTVQTPTRPVGRLTPIQPGDAGGNASGGFLR